jgi:hypothetical protein
MAAVSARNELAVWNLRTLERVQTFPGALIPLALSVEPWTLTALGTNYAFQMWDVAHGQIRVETPFARTGSVFTAKLSPNAKQLAVGYTDGTFDLWDVASRRQLWKHRGHKANVREFAFSADGRWLATASQDSTARLWDIAARREFAVLSAVARRDRRRHRQQRSHGANVVGAGGPSAGRADGPQGRHFPGRVVAGRQDTGHCQRRRHGAPVASADAP